MCLVESSLCSERNVSSDVGEGEQGQGGVVVGGVCIGSSLLLNLNHSCLIPVVQTHAGTLIWRLPTNTLGQYLKTLKLYKNCWNNCFFIKTTVFLHNHPVPVSFLLYLIATRNPVPSGQQHKLGVCPVFQLALHILLLGAQQCRAKPFEYWSQARL